MNAKKESSRNAKRESSRNAKQDSSRNVRWKIKAPLYKLSKKGIQKNVRKVNIKKIKRSN